MDISSLEQILAENEIIKIENSSNSSINSKELPFWLAYVLGVQNIVQFNSLPKCFKPLILEKLKSINENNTTFNGLNLRHISPTFYFTGLIVVNSLDMEGSEAFLDILRKTFQSRLFRIYDYSFASLQTENSSNASEFQELLDLEELKIYQHLRKVVLDYHLWESGKTTCGHIKALDSYSN